MRNIRAHQPGHNNGKACNSFDTVGSQRPATEDAAGTPPQFVFYKRAEAFDFRVLIWFRVYLVVDSWRSRAHYRPTPSGRYNNPQVIYNPQSPAVRALTLQEREMLHHDKKEISDNQARVFAVALHLDIF